MNIIDTPMPHGQPYTPPPNAAYFSLSRTTNKVQQILMGGDLYRLRADAVARQLGMSGTTLRRRLKADHTNYQCLLDRARQSRCESLIEDTWMPGKCVADKLGYLEVNSFYRAFRRWTGLSYSQYKAQYG
jgi:AraC family mar-sox-rob regulon transcriptional activator